MIRPLLTLLVKDLRATVRSGYFIVMGIVTPVVLAIVLNVVFGGVTSGSLQIPVGYVDDDQSETSEALGELLGILDDDGLLEVTALETGTDPAAALDDHDLRAVVAMPNGFEGSLAGNDAQVAGVEIIGDSDHPISVGVIRSIVSEYANETDRQRLVTISAAQLGIDATDPGERLVSTADLEGGSSLDIAARLGAAMGTMFLLIVALLGVTSLFEERDNGTLARLLAAPINRGSIIGAKILVSVAIGVTSGLAIVVATTLAISASWGAPAGVVALVVAFSLAAAAITLLITGAARTATTASNVQASAAVLLAVLGGGLVPLPAGGIVGILGRITPHFWFLEGLDALADGAWTAALPAAGILLAMAVVVGAPGLALATRRVTP